MALAKAKVWQSKQPSESLRIWPAGAQQQLTTSEQLQQATIALEVGHKAEARHLLEEVVQENPRSERAWLWLADAVDVDEERRFCLNHVLSINRRNALARQFYITLLSLDANPLAVQSLRHHTRCAGAHEGIKYNISGV